MKTAAEQTTQIHTMTFGYC